MRLPPTWLTTTPTPPVNRCLDHPPRSPCAPLMRGWSGTRRSAPRSKTSLAGLGVLPGYAGYLVRDDYAGCYQLDIQLAGVQQCAAHLLRHAKGVLELHPTQQQWAGQVIGVLREAATAVAEAITDGREQLDPPLLADLHQRYDHAVRWGITTNRHRDWVKGNHPGYHLATRLHNKAEQVCPFTRNLAVPR